MATPELPLATPNEKASSAGVTSEPISLPKGTPLNAQLASRILRAGPTPIILLAGAAKSGKTTLLASLHDSFQWQPFAGYLAAGSQTLIGFEERCFDSRAESSGDEPATIRTPVEDGLLIYHLRLRDENLRNKARNLLIADMSGELYERAVDSADEMKDLTIIGRADHFVHLVDGAGLESKDLRNLTQSNAMMLMRRCLEVGMLTLDARVDILLTKWDIVRSRCTPTQANALLEEQTKIFIDAFGPRVSRLRVIPIAARPSSGSKLPFAYGLDDIVPSWVEEPPTPLLQKGQKLPVPTLSRAFDTFALREAPELFDGGTNV